MSVFQGIFPRLVLLQQNGEFREDDHPRDDDGKFAPKGGEKQGVDNGKLADKGGVLADGETGAGDETGKLPKAERFKLKHAALNQEIDRLAGRLRNGEAKFETKTGQKIVSLNIDPSTEEKYPLRITHFTPSGEPSGHDIFKDYEEAAIYIAGHLPSPAPQAGDDVIHDGPGGQAVVNFRGYNGDHAVLFNQKTGIQFSVPRSQLKWPGDL